MSVVLSRLALRSPRRLLKGLVSGVGLALALAIGSPLLAGIGVTLPTLGSAMAVCPAATGTSFSSAYGPAYTNDAIIQVTFSATTGTTGCPMTYSILSVGGLTTSWGDYHYDNYNPAFGPPNPPSRYPSGVAFNIRPTAQGVVHWYYNYRECTWHNVPDKSWVASVYFAVSADNGPCSGEANANGNWVFVDRTVIYDTVAPVSSTAGGAPTYSTSRSVGVTYVSASDATSGVASVSVYRTLSATPATTDALCGTDPTVSPPTVITCATTADGTWRFYSRATDRAGNVEPLPTAADDTTIVDTVPPAAPNGTLTAQTWATQPAVNGIVYFNGNVSTSFTITSDGTDSSGIASNTFSAPAITTGWTTITAATVAGDPSARAYTWTSAAVATSITLKSTDNAGNIGAIRTITLTDDSTAPGSGISAPAADTQNTLISPAFSFTLSDAGSGIDAAASNWIRQWATLTANACGATWTTDTGPVSGSGAGAFSPAQAAMVNGRCYKWVLTAKDNVNNIASFTSQTIKVDTTPPIAPNGTLTAQTWATQPAVNGIVYFNGNVGSSFTITSDGSDPEPASGIASSTFSAPSITTGWTTITAATVAGDPSARAYTWTSAAVAASITLKSTDNAGNIGAIRTITLTDDWIVPAIAISAPATDTQNTLVSPAFTFTLSDATSGVDATTTSWNRQWTTLAANVCGATWTIDATGSGFGAGSSPAQTALVNGRCYRWYVVAKDNVNNSNTVYSNTIKVDTGLPTVGVPAPSLIYANAVTDLPPGWSVNWTPASDAISGVATVTMTELYGPVTTPASCTGVVWTVAWTLAATTTSFASVSGGGNNYCYAYKVNVTDNAGNVFTSAQGAPIFIDTVAPTHNGHTFSGGSNWFATGTALNPTVYVNTNVAGSVDVTAQVSDTGSGVKNVSFANPSGQAGWTYPQGVDPSPPYQVTVSWNAGADTWAGTPNSQPEDYAGNVSAWWQGWMFINDTSPPVIAWTNPTADVYDTTGSVTPSWTVTDTGSGVGSAGTVTRYYLPTLSANVCSGTPVNDGVQTSGTPATVTSGRCYYWTFTTPPSDILGNVTSTNLTSNKIKVDTVHPTGTLTFDDLSGVTHSRFINASVTMADANSGPLQVRFSTDGGFSWTAWTAYVVGTPTVTPLTLASGTGTYTVLAQIQDLAGNMTPLGHSTALLNAVIEPTLGAAAKIYDCATNTLLATNTTGTIYWSVDRTLCFVPTARLVAPGSDGTSSPTLVGTIAAPSGTPGNYILHDPDQTWTLVGGTWPPYVGVTRTAADTPLRFTFGRETSSLSTSTPYLTIPYDTQAVVGWYNGATLVRSETVTVTLNLRVVIKNSGTTGTH